MDARHAASVSTRRLFAKSALSWAVLAISLVAQAAIGAAYHLIWRALPEERMVVPLALLLLSIAATIAVFLSSSKVAFRLLMIPRSMLMAALLSWYEGVPSAQIALSVPLLLEATIYEPFFLNVLMCTGVLTLLVVSRVLNGRELVDRGLWFWFEQGIFVCFGLLFSVIGGLGIHYRERVLGLMAEVARLDQAVGKLASANLGYQEYARAAERSSMIEERKRISREIHDVIGYTMTSNIMMMEAAIDMVRRDPDRVKELMATARENARAGLDEIRHALYVLRAQEDQPEEGGISLIARLIKIFVSALQTAIIEGGIAAAGLLATIVTAKFDDALPLYRQEKQFARFGVELSRKTMADWMIAAATACAPLMAMLERQLRAGPILQMD